MKSKYQLPVIDRVHFLLIFIKKGQTRFTKFDDRILALYSRGMTTRDIAASFREMYGAEVSHTLVSKITEAVTGQHILARNKEQLLLGRQSSGTLQPDALSLYGKIIPPTNYKI